ncbi:glutamine and serine-rich protein 1-like isoform X2 [Zootermopsis nevadensis]|uniref:glutamine and serine-rich protein 1-like isoform X2 n=1 Tax=Zootermopsis nevadensis TaxID=136037 RepID=UPI000B8EAD2B|nr:glutamine and serine-rich protein 1-like isoform X2 [Zootermopsis nevadensis]
MKKKYAGDDSENEFSVDEPEELQGSDDDWTPGCGEGTGRRQSRRLRNSTTTKKPRLAEPSTSEEEEEEEEEEEGSDESDGGKSRGKKSKSAAKGGRGRPKKAQQVTSTSTPAGKPKGKPADNIVSCEATSTTGAPTLPTPTEKEFTSGAFVVLKTDFQNGGDPPIWKIDGKALLQKYVPFEQDGKTLYKNTSTYSGWSANNKEMYYPAPIVFKMQNRKETIVEFLRDAIKEDDSE